jgi:HEPN domain-containing protein
LTLEKLLKAFWVRDNVENIPPKMHNLNYLLAQTQLALSEEEQRFFAVFNQFQLEGRYPDYQFAIYDRLNETETTK